MQKVNDPKHSSKPSTEWLKKKKHGAAIAQLKPTSKEHAKTVMEETQKSTPSRPCWQTNESQCVLSFRTLHGVQKLFFKNLSVPAEAKYLTKYEHPYFPN